MSEVGEATKINELEEEVTRISGGPLKIRDLSDKDYESKEEFDINELSEKAKAAAAVFRELEANGEKYR